VRGPELSVLILVYIHVSQKGPNRICDFFSNDLQFPGDGSCSFIASVYEKAFLSCTQFYQKIISPKLKKLDNLTNVMCKSTFYLYT
jgi:hypothetical protein